MSRHFKNPKSHPIGLNYDPDIARQMCEQLSEGIPLRQICRQEGFPAWRTVYDWTAKDANLATAIARARDLGYDALAEECLDIADNATNDWMERHDAQGKSVGWQVNGDHIQRSKLRIETRLKLLAKFNPKKYGDKVEVSGDPDKPMTVDLYHTVFGKLLDNLRLQRQEEQQK